MDREGQGGHVGPTLSFYIYIYIYKIREEPILAAERFFFFFLFSLLLSSIYGVSTIGIRRAKKEISSTRRGLCMSTKNTGFRREFK